MEVQEEDPMEDPVVVTVVDPVVEADSVDHGEVEAEDNTAYTVLRRIEFIQKVLIHPMYSFP